MSFASLHGFSAGQIAFLLFAAFIAGLARGFSGFGAALIFVPLASAAIGPKQAVPLLLVIDAVAAAGMIPNAWRLANRKEVGVMAVGALVGVPVGAYMLAHSDPLLLRWGIVVLVVCLLGIIMSGWRYRGHAAAPLTTAVGSISGFFSGAAQVGGPPVVVYWLGGLTHHAVVRANIVLYFAISTVISGVSYIAGRLITMQILSLAIIGGPVFGLGLYLGSKLFGHVDELLFRRVCYALIAAAAIAGLPLWDGLLR